MVKNAVITALCLTTLIAAGWGWHENQELKQFTLRQNQAQEKQAKETEQTIKELREDLAQQQRITAALKKNSNTTLDQVNSRMGQKPATAGPSSYEKAIQGIKAQLAQAAQATSTTQPEQAKGAAGGNPLMSDVAKMMKNPEMKKMVQAQQKAMMDMTYGQLYSLLNLPEGQLAPFKSLLEKKQMQAVEIGLEMMDNSLTADQKQAKQKQIVEMNAQTDKEIEAALGKENYAIYKSFEETQAERMQVQMFNQGLDAGAQLNDKQQLDLVYAMHKARSEFKFSSGLGQKNDTLDPGSVTPEMVGQFLEDNKRLNAQYIDLAGKMLTPAQLEKFRASVEQQQSMQELGLRMLYGSGGMMTGKRN